MKTLRNRLASESGALRPIQYVLIMIGIAIIYSVVMYSPSLLDQMTMGNIADEAAAKMNIDPNPQSVLKSIVDNANTQNIHVGAHNVELNYHNPAAGGKNTVVIHWDEQVQHLWGTTQTLHKKVSAKAGSGEIQAVVKGK